MTNVAVTWIHLGLVSWLLCAYSAFTSIVPDCPNLCSCNHENKTITCNNLRDKLLITELSPNTETLHLHSSINTIPKYVNELQLLKHLDLSYNEISEVTISSFQSFKYLFILDLSSNAITEINEVAFQHLQLLETLDLSNNFLQNLPPRLFKGLSNLKRLNLENNKLGRLHIKLFQDLVSLERLDLAHNSLSFLQEPLLASASNLKVLNLDFNRFRWMNVSQFESLETVSIFGNPWDCSCSAEVMLTEFHKNPNRFHGNDVATCSSPKELFGSILISIVIENLKCNEPVIYFTSNSTEVAFRDSFRLDCLANGSPRPAIVWYTPWGDVFAHSSHFDYLQDKLSVLKERHVYDTYRLNFDPTVVAFSNGSLFIDKARGIFFGNYTCEAINYVGRSNVTLHLSIVHTYFRAIYIQSLIIGFGAAGTFLVFGMFVGLIKLCVKSLQSKRRNEIIVHVSDCDASLHDSTNCNSIFEFDKPHDKSFEDTLLESVQPSPEKCPTPCNGGDPSDRKAPDFVAIFDTLDEVRDRLRDGVGRKMEKVRSQVHAIQMTSSQQIQRIKDSSTYYIQTVKESSTNAALKVRVSGTNAAQKVRAGVVISVEQMKYGVQSLREFCGTGDLGQTISAVSMSTNVDTSESVPITQSFTMV